MRGAKKRSGPCAAWAAAGVVFLLPLSLSLSLIGCRGEHDAPAAGVAAPRIDPGGSITYAENAPELASLSSAAAAPAPAGTVHTTGRLAWDEDHTARVFPPVGGRVERLLAGLEQRVGRGAPLAAIESADFGQAQADANRAATDLGVAERGLARVRELAAHQAAPQKDVEAAQAERDRAAVESERARHRLALLGGGLGAVDQRFVLRSPIAGVVVDRAINAGLEVRADGTTPLFTVSDPARLWVYLDVVEQDLPQVRAGLPLVLRTNAYPRRTFAGRVEVVGDALDPATRTIKARGSVDNGERLLKAEMYVEVEVDDPARRQALEVPSAAVLAAGARRFVFVEAGRGRFVRREVTAGAERGGRTQIVAGLAPGTRVVVDGSLLLESLLTPNG